MTIIKIKEHRDGTATMTYDITPEEAKMFKEQAVKKHKKFDKDFINGEVLKALKRGMKDVKAGKATRKVK